MATSSEEARAGRVKPLTQYESQSQDQTTTNPSVSLLSFHFLAP